MPKIVHYGLGPSRFELGIFHKDVEMSLNELGTFNIWYYQFDRNSSVSNVLDEIVDKKYLPRVAINGFAILSPSRDYLDAIGVFNAADIVIDFSSKYADDNSLSFDRNDFFVFENIEYDIIEVFFHSRIGDAVEIGRNSYEMIKIVGVKRKKRISETIQTDQLTIKKVFGFLWNVN